MSPSQEQATAREEDDRSRETDTSAAAASASQDGVHAGRRRRRRLARLLDEDPVTTGSIELMTSADREPILHRLVLRGKELTAEGGPARVVLGLVEDLTRSIDAIMPTANPYLRAVQGSNSVEVIFYPPEEEVKNADARLASDRVEPGPQILPDTTLAVLALTHVLSEEDPAEAARAARKISNTAADRVRDLAVELHQNEVTLHAEDVRPGTNADPEWALKVVEYLDADEELEPVSVRVLGFLQGANSGGDGYFEIVTDEDIPLDPAFGTRRHAGDTIRGILTPRARREIRQGNLWDTHVRAVVSLSRKQKGQRIRIEEMRLLSVDARFH